jgi:hypothetical protein
MNDLLMEWRAPEYHFTPKTPIWYWGTIIVALLFLIAALWQKNLLFAFFILAAELLVLVWGSRKPDEVTFGISKRGIHIGERKFHSFRDLAGWNGEDVWEDGLHGISIYLKHQLRPPVRLYVLEEDEPELKRILQSTLPKIDRDETFIDTLERLTGF